MKITAKDLQEMGIVEQVFSEQDPVTQDNCYLVCQEIRSEIIKFLQTYKNSSKEEIVAERYDRFRKYM